VRSKRLVLGVDSVETSGDALGRLLIREGDAVAWFDPAKTFGLRFGFIEAWRGRVARPPRPLKPASTPIAQGR